MQRGIHSEGGGARKPSRKVTVEIDKNADEANTKTKKKQRRQMVITIQRNPQTN